MEELDEEELDELPPLSPPPPLRLAMSVQPSGFPGVFELGSAVAAQWGPYDSDPEKPELSWRGAVVNVSNYGGIVVLYDDGSSEYEKPPNRVQQAHGATRVSRLLCGDMPPGELRDKLQREYLLTLWRAQALFAAYALTKMTAVSALSPVNLGSDHLTSWPPCGMPGGQGTQLWNIKEDWGSSSQRAATEVQRAAADELLSRIREPRWCAALLTDPTTMSRACELVTAAVRPLLVDLVLGGAVNETWRQSAIGYGDAPDVQLFVEALHGVR